MRIEKDFAEFLGLLNKHKVKYCIIGAYAFAFYAIPRFTKDIDILVEPSLENSKKIIKALREFGFTSSNLTEKDFVKEGSVVQLGYPPVRIDLLTSIEACKFSQIWENRRQGEYGRHKVFFIELDELIASKKLANRPQDKIDLKILTKRRKRR